jgi:hypothetical protein
LPSIFLHPAAAPPSSSSSAPHPPFYCFPIRHSTTTRIAATGAREHQIRASNPPHAIAYPSRQSIGEGRKQTRIIPRDTAAPLPHLSSAAATERNRRPPRPALPPPPASTAPPSTGDHPPPSLLPDSISLPCCRCLLHRNSPIFSVTLISWRPLLDSFHLRSYRDLLE